MKRICSRMGKGLMCAAVLTTCSFALLSVCGNSATNAAIPRFEPCTCPHVYAPVICTGGRVFSNQCFASCAGATGCVPQFAPIEL